MFSDTSSAETPVTDTAPADAAPADTAPVADTAPAEVSSEPAQPLTLDEASDEDTLRDAIQRANPDADSEVIDSEVAAAAQQVAAARQWQDSRAGESVSDKPVVFPGG